MDLNLKEISKINSKILMDCSKELEDNFNQKYFEVFSQALDNALDINKLYKKSLEYHSDTEFYKEFKSKYNDMSNSESIEMLVALIDELLLNIKVNNSSLYNSMIMKVRNYE